MAFAALAQISALVGFSFAYAEVTSSSTSSTDVDLVTGAIIVLDFVRLRCEASPRKSLVLKDSGLPDGVELDAVPCPLCIQDFWYVTG